MSQQYTPLTDLQWQLLEPLFPKVIKRSRGKPHTPWRSVVNSIFYILLTGLKWSSLPRTPDFATKSASHRWFMTWDKTGFLEQLLTIYKGMSEMASNIKLPRRRNRLPASAKQQVLIPAVAS